MRHIVIAGPGRSGTSFLVRLLARLGIDCGGAELEFNTAILAGCEWIHDDRIRKRAWWRYAPKVIKGPYLSFMLDAAVEGGMKVEHVLIPVRDPAGVARSRIDTDLKWGGPDRISNKRKAEQSIGAIIACCTKHSIPFTVLPFPEHVKCPVYLRDAFRQIESLSHITLQDLCKEFWPLTEEHEALAYVNAKYRSDLSNQGATKADTERPENVERAELPGVTSAASDLG